MVRGLTSGLRVSVQREHLNRISKIEREQSHRRL